jgi:hypothetical protein
MQKPQVPGADLSHLFEVQRVAGSFRRAVPRRVASIRPFKVIPNYEANWMKVNAYNAAGLSEYNDCWTGEMASRPIPFISTDSKPLRTVEVFRKYIRAVLSFLAPHITPAIQTINKISSLGYPINANPGDGIDRKAGSHHFMEKVNQSKFDVVLDLFAPMMEGDFSVYRDGYHTIGCRKQNEPPSKLREFQFITDDGYVYQKEIDAREREIDVPTIGPMVGSRTRTITRPPVVNLFLQCWDTLLHNAIKRYPLFDSNVYVHESWPSDSNFVTFDCKHYERYLGLCAIAYAEAVGGVYEEQLLQLIYYPFIVPSDTWRSFFWIKPHYKPGVYPQFSSGLSPVAPLGKLTNICIQVSYFVETKGMDTRSAIATVFDGVSGNMRRWSFGDDNRLLGDKEEIKRFTTYLGEYLELEFDDPPKYLGTKYRRDLGRWCLPAETYNLKLYQPERDYEWKDYPNLGMVERRRTFTEYGEPEIGSTIIPYEDELWLNVGHPFAEIASAAVAERVKAQNKGVTLNPFLVSDKEYLMSEDQKVASGLFWHLKPDVTATIVLRLIGKELGDQLQFKGMHHAALPKSEVKTTSFKQKQESDNYEEEEESAL